jgi:hypothetical protein
MLWRFSDCFRSAARLPSGACCNRSGGPIRASIFPAPWRPLPRFPGDGLPGVTDLELHLRVLAMADLDVWIATAVTWLDKRAALQGAPDFLALDQVQRLAALDAAFASPDQGIQPFLLALRYHLGTAYYSAPAIKSAFAYTGPPQPDGFADFQERPA